MTCGFQLLELIVETVAYAALQQARDILIELAVLLPQGGNRHDHGGLHVPQVKDRLLERRWPWPVPPPTPFLGRSRLPTASLRSRGYRSADRATSPSLWPALHHVEHVTALKYEVSTL